MQATMRNELHMRRGEPAYDLVRGRPLVITDATTPTVGSTEEAKREKIMNAYGNELLGVDLTSETCEVAFLGVQSPATKTYTYPTERLVSPRVTEATGGLTPTQMARSDLLADLFREVEHRGGDPEVLVSWAEDAGVEPPVLTEALEEVRA